MAYLSYALWTVAPLTFFLLALWSRLEARGRVSHKREATNFTKQGVFVAACAVVTLVVDHLFLDAVTESLPVGLDREVVRFVAFPLILFSGATVLGPSREIRIGPKTPPGKRPGRR